MLVGQSAPRRTTQLRRRRGIQIPKMPVPYNDDLRGWNPKDADRIFPALPTVCQDTSDQPDQLAPKEVLEPRKSALVWEKVVERAHDRDTREAYKAKVGEKFDPVDQLSCERRRTRVGLAPMQMHHIDRRIVTHGTEDRKDTAVTHREYDLRAVGRQRCRQQRLVRVPLAIIGHHQDAKGTTSRRGGVFESNPSRDRRAIPSLYIRCRTAPT